MNNGKVRIYELSKELNLDNKELLAICDQLSIAVKSHSSTITELDAERIRTTAMKVAITTNVIPKQDRTSQINYSDDSASSPNQVDANKQKILEIRRPPKIQLKDSTTPVPEATINKQFLSSAILSQIVLPMWDHNTCPGEENLLLVTFCCPFRGIMR